MKSMQFVTMLLLVLLFSSVSLTGGEESFELLEHHASGVFNDIIGKANDNIFIINKSRLVGVNESNINNWNIVLKRLKEYIDKTKAWTTSAENKALISSALQQLDALSKGFFNTVIALYTDLIKNKAQIDMSMFKTELKRLLRPGEVKLEEMKRQLAPKLNDYGSTIAIKKALLSFADDLYRLYMRAQRDFGKLAANKATGQ